MHSKAWRMMRRQSVAVLGGLALVVAMSACARTPFRCDDTHQCDLNLGSVCTIDHLCAVREGECESGYVYDRSTLHAGTCVPRMLLDLDASADAGPDATTDSRDTAEADVGIDTFDAGPCDPPRLIAPLSVTRTPSNEPVFRWSPGAGATSVDIEVSRTRAFASPMLVNSAMGDAAAGNGVHIDAPLAPGVWFWRATSHCSDGRMSRPSDVWEFIAPHRMLSTAVLGFNGSLPGPLDLDGDGFADIAIGVPGSHAVLVYFGSASGIGSPTVVTGSGAFGSRLASAADVDGDGFSDLVVGSCPTQDESATGLRECVQQFTVVFGASNRQLTRTTVVSAPTMGGPAFGTGLGAGGDVDGDGYGDIVVGTSFYPSIGPAFVYFGHRDWSLVPEPRARIEHTPMIVGFGTSVAIAGDMDSDGLADVIIGSPGQAFFYRGFPTATRDMLGTQTPVDSDVDATTYLGAAVASAGDVNGDGYADVVLGDPGLSGAKVYAGIGSSALLANRTVPIGSQITSSGARAGVSVAGSADLDEDGYDDVVIGADGFNANSGAIQVLLGRGGGSMMASGGFVVDPAAPANRFGRAVAMAGPVDGMHDSVLVGAPGVGGGLDVGNGVAYLFAHDVAGTGTVAPPVTLMPPLPADAGVTTPTSGAAFGRGLALLPLFSGRTRLIVGTLVP